jgi:hypothetical protein
LWLSRDDVLEQEKDALLKALTSLEDTCGGFYYCRAYFLATEGLKEFQQSRHATEMLRQVVRWSFEQIAQLPTVGWLTSRLINEATKVLYKSDSQQVVTVLKEFFWESQSDPCFQCEILSRIGSFKQEKPFAVQELDRLLQSSDPFIRCEAAVALYPLAPKHPGLVAVLPPPLLDPIYDESIRLSAANLLKDNGSSFQTRAVETLHELSKNAEDDEIQELATSAIWALEDLNDLSDLSTSDLPEEFGNNAVAPLPSLDDLLEQLSDYRPESTQARATVKALFRLLFSTDNLVDIMVDKETAIQVIRVLKQQSIDNDLHDSSFESLEAVVLLQRCAEVVPFSIFHEAWQSGNDTALLSRSR